MIPRSQAHLPVDAMIQAAVELLEADQEASPCRENELALAELDAALVLLNARNIREADGTLADQVVPKNDWSKKCGNEFCGCSKTP